MLEIILWIIFIMTILIITNKMLGSEIIHDRVEKAEYDQETEIMTITYNNKNPYWNKNGKTIQYHGSVVNWVGYPEVRNVTQATEVQLNLYYKYNKIHKAPYIKN